jgi:anaphase-promoting complex subunit 1
MKKPTSDKGMTAEREGYALAAGIGMGLVNLGGQRSNNTEMQSKLADLQLDDKLLCFIEGGKNMNMPRSMLSQTLHQDNSAKSSAIKENDMVNVHITSSGGLVALTLIHLKSNNQAIA